MPTRSRAERSAEFGRCRRRTGPLVVAALSALALAGCRSAPHAPLAFDDAVAAAGEEGLVVVSFTADWCGPCKRMEATTWRDPEVLAWLDAHAVRTLVDIDADGALAERFGVSGIPVTVVLRGGDEVDRLAALRAADETIAWLEGVRRGRLGVDAMRDRLRDRHESGEEIVLDEALEFMRECMRHDLDDEALDIAQWIWDRTTAVDPHAEVSSHPARADGIALFIAIRSLGERHAPARDRFRVWAEVVRPIAEHDVDAFRAWLHASIAAGEWRAVADLLGRIEATIGPGPIIMEIWDELTLGLLIRGECAAAVRAWRLGLGRDDLAEWLAFSGDAAASQPRDFRDLAIRQWRLHGITLHAALVGAGEDDEAERVAAVVLQRFNDAPTRLALVERAVAVGRVTALHERLVRQAAQQGAWDPWIDEAVRARGR